MGEEFYGLFADQDESKLPGLMTLARTFLPRNRTFFKDFVWRHHEARRVHGLVLACLESFTLSEKSLADFSELGLAEWLWSSLQD